LPDFCRRDSGQPDRAHHPAAKGNPTMPSFRSDPLLGSVRALLLFVQGALVVGTGGLLLAIPTILVFRAPLLARLAQHHPALAHPELIILVCGLLATMALILAAMWFFTRKLRQIVETVATGDPFIPENAVRLRTMAWLLIALQVIALPAALLETNIVHHTGYHSDIDVSLSGILLALVLFVLARVFHTGTAMRAELEGTV